MSGRGLIWAGADRLRRGHDDESARRPSGQVAGLSLLKWRGHGDVPVDGIWRLGEGLRAGFAGIRPGTLVGVEALLRWDHPTRGLVQPDEFIPILEQSGQIIDVGRWVLRQACEQMVAWHARGETLEVSVNVSGRQLDRDTVVDDIREALRVSGLPAESLIVEVTETVLMRNTDETAQRLRAGGRGAVASDPALRLLTERHAGDDFMAA
jgi:EAL domain